MMTIDQKIEEVCRRIDGLSYQFNDWTRANVDLESVSLPVLINVLPVEGSAVFKNGIVRETRSSMFGILDKTDDIDSTATQDYVTVNRMREYKKQLIVELNRSDYFEPIEGEIKDAVTTDKLDVNLVGIVFEIKIKEKNGICAR